MSEKRRSSMKEIERILLQQTKFIAKGESPIDELGLVVNGEEDRKQLKYILKDILTYPSTELAQLHRDSNRLGDLDLKNMETDEDKKQQLLKEEQSVMFCPCCGFIKQQNSIKMCTSIKNLNNIGVSTYLYFETLSNIIILLLVSFVIYSIFSLVANIISSEAYRNGKFKENQGDEKLNSIQGFLVISLGSNQLNQRDADKTFYEISCWLGAAVILIWGIIFIWIKYKEKLGQEVLLRETKSAADFSITIENYPVDMDQSELQRHLQEYEQNIRQNNWITQGQPIKIAKLNLAKSLYIEKSIFQHQELQEMNKQFQQYIEQFVRWIIHRQQNDQFDVSREERIKAYKDFNHLKEKQVIFIQNLTQNVQKQLALENKDTTVAFVTFQHQSSKDILLNYNEEDVGSKIRNFFMCCTSRNKLILRDYKAYIKQAPEPQDIIWTNLGQSMGTRIKKKLITFFITLIVLGISFLAVYGLSRVQVNESKNKDSTRTQYISILISLVISIFNLIIIQVLRLLTVYERDYTYTYQQASLGIKAVLALMINSILIPIIVNRFLKKNLYGVNGLAYDIFLLGITNSFLPPLIKIFDAYYYFTRILSWYFNKPKSKVYLNQPQLNKYTEYIEFQVGYQYIPTVNIFLFTCFFCPLQPIIIAFAIVGSLIMFWAQKYSLFSRCRRPTPGNRSVNTAMYTLIYLGPAFFTLGSFCWSHFFRESSYISIGANLTSAIISFLIFIMPYRFISNRIAGNENPEDMSYQENRILFPAEYDRLNPDTSSEAVEEYVNYVNDYKYRIKKEQKDVGQIERLIMRQVGRGHRAQNNAFNNLLGGLLGPKNQAQKFNANVANNLFGLQNQNSNPLMLMNTIIPQEKALNLIIQNWNSEGQKKSPQNPFVQLINQQKQPNNPIGVNQNGTSPMGLLPINMNENGPNGKLPNNNPQTFPAQNNPLNPWDILQNYHHSNNPFSPVGGMDNPFARLFDAQMPQNQTSADNFNPYEP